MNSRPLKQQIQQNQTNKLPNCDFVAQVVKKRVLVKSWRKAPTPEWEDACSSEWGGELWWDPEGKHLRQSFFSCFEPSCARHYNSGSHWAVLELSLLDNGIKRKGQGRWKTKQTNPQTTNNRNHQSLTNRVKGETSSGSHGNLQSPALTTSSAGNSQRPMQCIVTL